MLFRYVSMSPDKSHRTIPVGRSPCWTETVDAVATSAAGEGPAHAATTKRAIRAVIDLVISHPLYAMDAKAPPA
jgi:hypothetical protein